LMSEVQCLACFVGGLGEAPSPVRCAATTLSTRTSLISGRRIGESGARARSMVFDRPARVAGKSGDAGALRPPSGPRVRPCGCCAVRSASAHSVFSAAVTPVGRAAKGARHQGERVTRDRMDAG
jgi:hypothetical protein